MNRTDAPVAGAAEVGAVFARHRHGLLRLAVLLVGDLATAEDVVQDAFVGLQRRAPQLRTPDSVLPYARASVVNGCRSVLRRRAVVRRRGPTREVAESSAEAVAMLSAERQEVALAMRRLSPRRREVLVLRYYLDLSDAEIAAVMGIGEPTVRSLAASPDGTRLAYVTDDTANERGWPPAGVNVVDTAAGTRTTYRTATTGEVDHLAWDGSGRYLGFAFGGSTPATGGLWVLDTARPGDLLVRSRKVPTTGLDAGLYSGIVLSADARTFYLVSGEENMALVEADVATGSHREITRIAAARQPASPGWSNFIVRSPAGSDLLLTEAGGVCHRFAVPTFAATDVPCDGGSPQAVAW